MNSDTKVIIGVIIATALVIGGGAFWASRTPAQGPEANTLSSDQANRLVRDDDPVAGAQQDAQVTVVEFGDFECPACGALHGPLKQVKTELEGQPVRFVYRQFPLTQAHPNAQLAAEASLAAQAQGKFWEYHDVLFENQTQLERADLERYAESIGLNMDEFRVALDERTYQDAVAQDIADGRALSVRGTPTLYINNTQYTSQYSPTALKAAIESQLQQ